MQQDSMRRLELLVRMVEAEILGVVLISDQHQLRSAVGAQLLESFVIIDIGLGRYAE
ncbi:hypothetical protein PLEOSDRAFT_1075576 [Pleurotus ostreatus PC15]|uniref:Uncharacterized protein n=1 Tax=Pleurotus ostreatus (strain PC15) TaxID=1137138 RepID=A0A067P554_PLEO1|nr:hypothetical protein PLEOSDRAFT_1075576 [Pleurotus ostreatus PC15]